MDVSDAGGAFPDSSPLGHPPILSIPPPPVSYTYPHSMTAHTHITAVRAMEGHAATLLEDRWMVMVGGFGTRGVENEVYMLDTWALEAGEEGEAASAAWWRLAEQGQRPNVRTCVWTARLGRKRRSRQGRMPLFSRSAHSSHPSLFIHTQPPVYGHVACALGPRRLAVFGGCTMGGYAGVTNDLYILDLELDKNGPLLKGGEKRGDGRPRLGGVVTWRRTQALGQSLTRWVLLVACLSVHEERGASVDQVQCPGCVHAYIPALLTLIPVRHISHK